MGEPSECSCEPFFYIPEKKRNQHPSLSLFSPSRAFEVQKREAGSLIPKITFENKYPFYIYI